MAALTRSAHWIQNTTVPVSPPTSTLSETEDAFAADHGVDVKHAVQGLVLNVPLFLSNATVVFILLASGRFRQHGDWLILSLCAINVPMCGVVATIVLIKYFSGVYPGRYNVCYLQAFCIIFQNSVNLMTTVTLSLERCAAVTKPFWYRANVKENKLAIIFALVFIYTISAIYAILPIVSSEIGHVGLSYSFCNIPWTSPKNRTLSILTASLASVLVLTIFILDVLTAKAVLRGRQRRQCLNSRKSQRDAEEDSTTRVVLVVTGLYAIAFVPGTVVIFMQTATGEVHTDLAVTSQRLFAWMALWNPFVVCLLRRSYREEVKKFFAKLCPCFNCMVLAEKENARPADVQTMGLP